MNSELTMNSVSHFNPKQLTKRERAGLLVAYRRQTGRGLQSFIAEQLGKDPSLVNKVWRGKAVSQSVLEAIQREVRKVA